MQKTQRDSTFSPGVDRAVRRGKRDLIGKLLVVGWDGADPDLVDVLCAQGKLPNLQCLRAQGAWGRVTSTYPASSLPAWTSALTGVGPAEHGLVHYIRRDPGAYRLRLVDAREREMATLQRLATRAGLKVASLGVPGSFPPDALAGLCIAGFDSPFALRADRGAYHPPELYEMLRRQGLGWPYGDMDESAVGPGWHVEAGHTLFATMQEKLDTAEFVLTDLGPFDMFMIVFSESDTAGHHFWAFHDKRSPRYRFEPNLQDTLEEVYIGLDRCLGELMQHCNGHCAVMVLSDHGFLGAGDTVFSLNRWLYEQGYLRFGGHGSIVSRAAGGLSKLASRLVPAWGKQFLLRSAFSGLVMRADALSRFGGLDLPATRAFCDELPQYPGIWIHLKGRDPYGMVEPGRDYEDIREEIIQALPQTCCTQQGEKMVARVFRREEVLSGPFVDRAADLLVELASIEGYGVLCEPSGGRPGPVYRKLSEPEKIGAKGLGISGMHRPEGMLAMSGFGQCRQGGQVNLKLEDVFYILASWLDLEAGVKRKAERLRPREKTTNLDGWSGLESFTDEADLKKRLENLGYL